MNTASSNSTTTAVAGQARSVPDTSRLAQLRAASGLAAASLLVFGFLYALAGVGLGQALFPTAANGSLIEARGKAVGSALVAQPFAGERWFHPRPSAAGHDLMKLAGSNQARSNPELRQRLAQTRAVVAQQEGVDAAAVPTELYTQSGSGIDPHISPQGAAIQVARVARARGLAPDAVARVVAQHTEPPQFGVLGQARVNVLQLNLALEALPR
jgi:K+-transporting ATPase ATPase C chain